MRFEHAWPVWLLWLAVGLLALPLQAATGPWGQSGPVQARVITADRGLSGQAELMLGLQIRLEPGWKTYWRTPGAAGAAPELKLEHPALEPEPEWLWPAPHRYSLLDMQAYGYGDELVLPVRYRLNTSQSRLALKGEAQIYACNELCLPLNIPVRLDLALDSGVDWDSQRLLNQYLARVPAPLDPAQAQPRAVVDDRGLYLELQVPNPGAEVDLFVEGYWVHDWPDPQIRIEGNRVRAWWDAPEGAKVEDPDRPLRFTYVDRLQAREGQVTADIGQRPASDLAVAGWAGLLLMAWLGGLVLNVMPCVLPVLSIKLMHLSEASSLPRREARLQLLLTVAGILGFFSLLALVLAGLKAAGYWVGWGIQFQNPYFLLFMLLLMLLFAANLLGWFEFGLPGRWQTALAQSGDGRRHSPRFASFMQGMAATLLATPCSAPFLGTAVAFALGRGLTEILAVFTALGIGLATPYGLLMLWPGMVRRLPRPGRWMTALRRMLALGLVLTAVWMLWLLSNHLSSTLIGVMALGALCWLILWSPPLRRWRLLLTIMTPLLLVTPLLQSTPVRLSPLQSAAFEPDRIATLVQQGRTVLVDITADWCITCKYNQSAVLDSDEVRARMQRAQVVFMQGDWSLPDPVIEAYLQRYGRSGIPFNAVFGPGRPEGVLLPELLTVDNLTGALRQATGPVER
ncbi:protein-disulfide reductase DsbD family protein [Marinobacterium aestuariivivens]|uniref:Protein-disulfide reductase DsbD family protein n=1 Tax=Marinobacterium aestuariivivens TaxID=1698799 RepID=A0ABW2A865_9GAMM